MHPSKTATLWCTWFVVLPIIGIRRVIPTSLTDWRCEVESEIISFVRRGNQIHALIRDGGRYYYTIWEDGVCIDARPSPHT